MSETAKLKIFRFHEGMEAQVYTDYEVPMSEVTTVLQALFYIRDNYDDVPAFRRYQCNRGQCVSCVMNINRKIRRACTTKLEPEMLLEPTTGYPVVRDLVVDFGTTFDGNYKRQGTVIERERQQLQAVPRFHLEFDGSLCDACGVCVAVCPKNKRPNVQSKYGEDVTGGVTLAVIKGTLEIRRFCYQCDPAACMNACPLDAISRDPASGAVTIIEDKCIACGLCVVACPYENIGLYMERGKAIKCDLCLGKPKCVPACPQSALILVGQKKPWTSILTGDKAVG